MDINSILNGSLSLVFVIISTIVGIIIISRYFQYRVKTILYMGFAIILIACPWWSSTVSFLKALITGGSGLTDTQYLILGNIAIPGFHILFTAALTELKFENKKRILMAIVIIIAIVWETLLFIFSSNEYLQETQLGILQGITDVEYRGFLQIGLTLTIFYILFVGILISRESIRSDQAIIKLKGKFLLTSFILFTIGSIADSQIPLDFITLPIIRFILIFSSICFYFGFILPKWLENLLIK